MMNVIITMKEERTIVIVRGLSQQQAYAWALPPPHVCGVYYI